MVLGEDGAVVGEIEWHKEKSHSEKITVMLEELLAKSGRSLKDLELLICGHGPGSFTGLRVGLSVVKTLAYAFQLPIIAVDDCLALAMNSLSATPTPICAMIDAQKNKVFVGLYKVERDKLVTLLKPSLLGLEELNQQLTLASSSGKFLAVGDGYDVYATFFPSDLAAKFTRANSALFDEPKARNIFSYVSKNFSDFQKIKWPELSALYLRASAAEEVLADKLSKKR